MHDAPDFLRVYHTLRTARTDNTRWFDVAFTPESLQHNAFGGLRCRVCSLPAIYHTLHLNVFVNGRPIGATTTRFLPICVLCHEFEGEVARLCLTTKEAIGRGLVHQPSRHQAREPISPVSENNCGTLTDCEL